MLEALILLAGLAGAPAPPAAEQTTATYDRTLRDARDALARGDDAAAMTLLDAALRLDPDGADAFLLLGRTYRKVGRPAAAETVLKRAVSLLGETTPAGQDALCELAAAYGAEEKNEEAIQTLRKVTTQSPARAGTHRDLGMIDLAIGRLEAAAEEFRKEIALHSNDRESAAATSAYQGLGIASYRMGDDAAALDALSRAPDTIDARYHLGLALARSGRADQAAAAFRDVLKREPDHRGALQNLARAAGALGLDDERRAALDRFQSLYVEEEKSRSLRIRVRDLRKRADDRVNAGDVAGAIPAMEEAASLSPDDVDLLLDLGRLYTRSGDAARSEQICRRVLARDPARAEAHYRIGRILADRGDLSGAVSSLEQATRLEPMTLTYHVGLAQIYLRVGRGEDGVRELRLARRLNPEDPAGSFNLGLGLAQAGRFAEAAAELEAAVKLGFQEPTVHQALAQVYRAMGDVARSDREMKILESLSEGKKP